MILYTKLNFILGQCGKAEIQARPLWRWRLVNTGWTNYKIQSVLFTLEKERVGKAKGIVGGFLTCLFLLAAMMYRNGN